MTKNKKGTKIALWTAVFTLLFCVLFSICTSALIEMPSLDGATSVYLYNLTQDRVMAEKNADKVIYPASTVKLMTGLVAAEQLSDRLDEQTEVTEEMLKGVTGNNLKIAVGEIVTVRDMFYGLLCGGNNDCAAILAHVAAGSIPQFVELMNKKAKDLGTKTTNYTNVSGMHSDNMVTTAYDTYLVAEAAYKVELIMEAVTTNKYEMPATNKSKMRSVYNKNYLISRYIDTTYYNSLAQGMNAGFTNQGGYCLVTSAEYNGQSYICVVMGAEEQNKRIRSYEIASDLIDWAFEAYSEVKVLGESSYLSEIAVTLSQDTDHVTIKPAGSLTAFLPSDIDVSKDIELLPKLNAPSLEAPVVEGQVVGFISVKYGDEVLGTVNLITTDKVERSEFLYTLQQLKSFTSQRWFIASMIVLVLLTVAYIFVVASVRGRHGHRRRRRR
ncbi:MAG: D-alanyl-D-alanine carboxypeptidase [Clostridia bacterium]|nr:D-alanyl-D-alanine carboxypeptidase [Clostridia bacterium]